MGKIKFIDGEKFCRYNNILMNEENTIKLFGTDYTDIYSTDFIIWEDGTLYTDLSFSDIVKELSYKDTDENNYVIEKETADFIKNIKPVKMFKKEHPNIKIKKIIDFNNELDCFYNELKR